MCKWWSIYHRIGKILFAKLLESKNVDNDEKDRYLLFSSDIALADLFLRQRMKSELAGVCYVPGDLRGELGWRSPKCRQKQVRRRHSAVDGPLRKVRINRLGLDLKKSGNNGVFKMISMKAISPCAFVSDHTSYVSYFKQQYHESYMPENWHTMAHRRD